MDTTARHEIRESYDVASPDGLYPDEHAPEFRQAINDLAPPMCELTFRLLKCMALALGKWIIKNNVSSDCFINFRYDIHRTRQGIFRRTTRIHV